MLELAVDAKTERETLANILPQTVRLIDVDARPLGSKIVDREKGGRVGAEPVVHTGAHRRESLAVKISVGIGDRQTVI